MKELTYPPGVIGMQVTDGPSPERVAAMRAHELEKARRIAPQADFSDFDVVRTGPVGWSFIDRATGTEFRRVAGEVLNDPDATRVSRLNIACFVVDAGGALHFLRVRGTAATPTSVIYHGEVYGRQLS